MCEIYEIPIGVIMWGSVNEADVSKDKKVAFRVLKPLIDKLIEDVFY